MKQCQLRDMELKMVVSLPEIAQQRSTGDTLRDVLAAVSEMRSCLTSMRSVVERNQNLAKVYSAELSNFLLNHQTQSSAILHEKDKQAQSLRKMLEESKRRNMDFLQMIELEFKKKDDVAQQLEQSVKSLQLQYDELEEQHQSKLEEFEQYKQLMERMIKQNEMERRESSAYLASLEKELHGVRNTNGQQTVRFEQVSNIVAEPVLEVIDEVTETCLTTEKDDDDIDQLTRRFKSIDGTSTKRHIYGNSTQPLERTDEQYDFRKDLEIVLKLSKDRIENIKEKENSPDGNALTVQTAAKRPHNSFIKAFRSSLQNEPLIAASLSTKTTEASLLCLDFPCTMSLTLLPLSNTDTAPDMQRYIGNYQYQGSFDEHGCRSGYGMLRKNKKVIYEGDWESGLFHGWGKLTISNSRFVDYLGGFEKGYFSGRGTLNYTNGDQYIGQIRSSCIEGEGTLYQADGQRTHGVWQRNSLKQRY